MALNGGRIGSRGVGESLIHKRRQRDDHLASYTDCVKGLHKMHSRAEWEHTLHVKAEATHLNRTVGSLKNQQESQLHSRRLRLTELYNREMETWKQQCLENVETPEDRKQNMIQRALELKERRERERRAIVEEKRFQQYRESCDDARVEDSLKVQNMVFEERRKQLDERLRLEEEEREYEARMAQLWEEDRLKKEERERLDREKIIKGNEEVKSILDLQVELCKKQRAELEEKKREEDRDLLAEWQHLKYIEDELERQTHQQEILRAMDVKKFNQERVESSRLAAERERQYDMKLLELALAQESETQRRERELQGKFKQDQMEYQQMLRRQMEAEAEDHSQVDKLRQDMEKEVWAKRDAQHNAEEAARQELLRQVLISRKQQTAHKQQVKLQKRHEDFEYMERVKRESEEALQKELREQEERQKELKRNQSDILRHVEEQKLAEEQRQQAEFLEMKRLQQAEKKLKERVSQFAEHRPPSNYRRKTAQWYFDA